MPAQLGSCAGIAIPAPATGRLSCPPATQVPAMQAVAQGMCATGTRPGGSPAWTGTNGTPPPAAGTRRADCEAGLSGPGLRGCHGFGWLRGCPGLGCTAVPQAPASVVWVAIEPVCVAVLPRAWAA